MDDSNTKISKCRIVVDAMGGDYAPQNAVIGAINAYNDFKDFDLILVGKKDKVLDVIKSNNLSFDESNIVNADEVIEMSDSPTTSLKSKPNSSIVTGTQLVPSTV